jgi:transposase
MYHVGIDISQQALDWRVLDDHAQWLGPARREANTTKGILRLLQALPEPEHCKLYFEATGAYGKNLIRLLDGRVAALYEVNPKILKNHGSTMTTTKTDSADASAIADAGHTLSLKHESLLNRYLRHYDEQSENLRLYLSEYDRLRRTIAQLKQRRQQLSCEPASAAASIRQQLLTEIEQHEKRQRELVEQIEQHSACEDVELVHSIKGIGRKTAAAVCQHLGHIERFESADQLKAHLGIYPRRNQSGNREATTRMAKHGNKLVRHLLWNCAKSAAKWNAQCHALYKRQLAKGQSQAQAWGAVMRKLVQIIYGVLKNRTQWNPNTT